LVGGICCDSRRSEEATYEGLEGAVNEGFGWRAERLLNPKDIDAGLTS